jgi:NitT/TauT family transport system substrate-binding protein
MSNAIRRALAGIVLSACLVIPAGSPRAADADDALTLIAGNPTPGIFDTLELVAAGAGFYKLEHLNVTKDYSANPSTATQLVASGKADVLTTSVEPVLTGYEKGVRLQFFLSRQARYSYVLGVLSDSPIRSLADFSGKTLGETNAGGAAEVATESMLGGAGLKSGDYSFVPIGTGAQGLTAITSKRVDAVAFPLLEIVRDEVVGHIAFRVFRHPILRDIGNVAFAAPPAMIAAKSDVLKRFSRAIVMAALFVRANPVAAARLYLQGSGQPVTPEAVAETAHIYELLRDDLLAADPADKRIGLVSASGLELYDRYLVDYGFAHQVAPASALATDRFIAYANDFDHRALIRFAQRQH